MLTGNSRRMRVLHVGKFYPPHKGGMENHLQLLCTSLQRHVDVTVVVSSEDRHASREIDRGVEIVRVPTRAVVWSAPLCPGMVAAMRAAAADIVHLHHPNPAAALACFASRHRGPLVITYHSDIVRQKLLNWALDPIIRRLLRRAQAVVSLSPNYIETSPILRACREKCHVIPHGIDPRRFSAADPADVGALRRRYGPRIVLAIGRLVYYKGFECLIRAMRDVDGRLLIVGCGPLRQQLENTARTLGIADRVLFLGEAENVVSLYHSADIFVLPSIARSEAFGIVQLEAMACGKPIVNTQLDSGVPYVSPNGVTGLTVPPGDSQALACAINTLLDNDTLRQKYGEAGRRLVAEEFTADLMTRRTLELYARVWDGESGGKSGACAPARAAVTRA